MYFSASLITLIASSPFINALPADSQALVPRDDPNSPCGVAFYIGAAADWNSECKVSTSLQAGGHDEQVLTDNKQCDQKNVNYATNGLAGTGVRDFTITQNEPGCDGIGGNCYPVLT